MTRRRYIGILVGVGVALGGSTCGRRHEPAPAGGLAVEEPHGQYIVVTARGGSSNEIPATSLRRLSSRLTPSIQLDTLKVDFRSKDDEVIATVYALTVPHGNPHRYEDSYKPLLGVHSARLGQRIEVKELAKLGYVPITYRVVSAVPPAGSHPDLISKAPSIEILLLEEKRGTYKLTLHNKSQRDLMAYASVRDEGNNTRTTSVVQSYDPSHPLIPAGATYAREFAPMPHAVLAAALFADGSHEGDSEVAATLYAAQLGMKTEGRRADPLIRRIIADRRPDDTAKIAQIRAALSGLPSTPDDRTLRVMQAAFPDLPRATVKRELGQGLEGALRHIWSSLYELEHQNAVYPPPKTHPPLERWWPLH